MARTRPLRPKQHQSGDRGVGRTLEVFRHIGWAASELQRDYGEDLIVQPIDEEGRVDDFHILVQCRALSDLAADPPNGEHVVELEPMHGFRWTGMTTFLMFVLWDQKRNAGYYVLQDNIASAVDAWRAEPSGSALRLPVPTRNRLEPAILPKIRKSALYHHHALRVSRAFAEQEIDQDAQGLRVGLVEATLEFLVDVGAVVEYELGGEERCWSTSEEFHERMLKELGDGNDLDPQPEALTKALIFALMGQAGAECKLSGLPAPLIAIGVDVISRLVYQEI